MADNDQFRILVGGTATNAGFVEIATADDGTEPIYVRQYTGVFSTLTRTLTLLDGSGNTFLPGYIQTYANGVKWDESGVRSWSMYPTGGGMTIASGDNAGYLGVGISGGIRAPIYYDSNDTGYYTDPASTSTLNLINCNGVYLANGWLSYADDSRNPGDANHLPTTKARAVRFSFTGASYTGTGGNYSGVMHFSPWDGTSASTGDAAYQLAFGSTATNGSGYPQLVLRKGIDTTWNSWYYIPMYGLNQYTSSFYATIFYDSGDTGYYGDFANTGTSINAAGSIRGTYYVASNYSSTGYTQYKGYDNNNHFIAIRCQVGGTTTSPTFTGQHSTTFVEYAEANDTTGWVFKTSATGNYDVVGRISRSYSYFEGSIRSPLFYDSDNTAYYVNPNGASNLSNYLNVGSYIDVSGAMYTRDFYYVLNAAANGWNTVIDRNGGNSWIVYGGGSVRAPVFYDNDDTGYYCNPNSTSNLQLISSTGQDQAYSARCDLASGSGSWSARIISRNYTTNVAAFLGNYQGYAGLFGHSAALDAWSPIYINAFGGTANANVYLGNMYSPIFYDLNDTGYYCNPNSSSNFSSLSVVGNITVSAGNTTGNGIILADDGDIVDLNDGYCSMRFSYGLRVFSGNRTGSAQVALTYQGNVVAAGNITAYGSPSDRKLKENVKPLTGALDKVMQLQGCTFDWKEDSEQHTMVGLREDIGFIADEVQSVIPEMVREGADGYLSLRDRGFSALLVEAVKEQQKQIEEQQSEIDELKSLVKQLLIGGRSY
jgi:hypothetical protein